MMRQINQQSARQSWLSQLTSQSIPEESDRDDYATDSDCSSILSAEECYLIVACKRRTSSDLEEGLCYAKICDDEQSIESMIVETPIHLQTIEHQSENFNFAKVTEVPIRQNQSLSQTPGSFSQQEQQNIDLDLRKRISPEAFNLTRSSAVDRACIDKYENHKSSSLIHLLKKRSTNRTVQSEFYPSTNEPLLLRLKNLDNRQVFVDENALETIHQSQLLTTSISSRKDQSYRKRWFNRLQKFLRNSPKIFL